MAIAEQIKSLIDQMPEPDKGGVYFGISSRRRRKKDPKADKAAAAEHAKRAKEIVAEAKTVRKIAKQIHATGKAGVLALIDLQIDPGEDKDYKAHFALHCVALHADNLGDKARAAFAATLASKLGGATPKPVQKYLLQELMYVGGPEVVEAVGKAVLDPDLCEFAARALTAIGTGAAKQFRAALQTAKGPAKLTLIQNLGAIADTASVDALRSALTGGTPESRTTAAWALATLGDAGSADALCKAADAQEAWERVRMTDACLKLAEALIAADKKEPASKIYTRLHETRTAKAEAYIRTAAEKALDALK